MKNLNLTPLEQFILDRSSDPGATRRRRTVVIISGLTAALLLSGVTWVTRSWHFVLAISLLYVGITVAEKVGFANTLLVYKNVIQKLKMRIEELESGKDSGKNN